MNRIVTLFMKEFRDAFRDKRSFSLILGYGIGMPIFFAGIFFVTIQSFSEKPNIPISIQGAENGPDLVRFLNLAGVHHGEGEDTNEITLIIPDSYAEQLSSGKPAEVIIEVDTSKKELMQPLSQLKNSLRSYSQEMAALRLMARGINPQVVHPIDLVTHDLATNESKSIMILGSLLMSFMMTVFFSGMNVAIDTSAGERERNSLTLLLCQPITTKEIVIAKSLLVSCFAMLGLLLTLAVSMVVFPQVPWQELGFSFNLDVAAAALILIGCLPLALMASSLQLFVSFFAKTFKEAQTYLTMVLMVPVVVAMLPMFEVAPDVMKWLPLSGQQILFSDWLTGRGLTWEPMIFSTLTTLVITAALTYGNIRALRSEKVIFAL